MNNRYNVWVMYLIALLQGMVFYGPIATLYRQAQGVSVFEFTIIESISMALTMALEIPWGYVADKIGYKKTLIICNMLFFVSRIVFWKAAGFALFLLERIILSFVMSGLSGCDSAYLFLSAGDNNSQKVFSVYTAMSTAGLVIASLIFSAVYVDNYSFMGFLTVITYGISMILTFFLKDIEPSDKIEQISLKNIKRIFSSFWQDKSFILFLIAAMLLVQSEQTITVFLNQLQYVKAGISQKNIGLIYIAVSTSGLLASFSNRLTGYIGIRKICNILFICGIASCVVLTVTVNPVLSVFSIILLRIASSLFAPVNLEIQNQQVKVANRATMLSLYSTVLNTGAVFTNVIFGKLTDIELSMAFGIGALFCLCGLFIFNIWIKRIESNYNKPSNNSTA